MNKKIAFLLTLALITALFAGCAGTPVVYYTECTCPAGSHNVPAENTQPSEPADLPVAEGSVKTGLAIVTGIGNSQNAAKVEYDVTMVAVNVDDNGIITACVIDSLGATVAIDGTGAITSDVNAEIKTKNELGDSYGMAAVSKIQAEWYQQANALAAFAVGKTVEELRYGAIDEATGKAPEGTDLASSATIYLGGYVSAIEEAVNNARHLGAQAGDTLKLASVSTLASSVGATAEAAGTAQLDCTVTALTENGGVITSCAIDSVQAKVSFDATGTITTDLTAPVLTKNQLGADYNMVKWGNAKAEWNEQAASFAAYVTGKTAAEVAGIAVTEGKPADADLAASVTISIGDFQNLIAKALAQ